MRQALWFVASALAVTATPALADVKAGVDAWARGDYRKAIDEWRGPAIAGDPDAQFNLGQAYKLGRGVTVDLAIAEDWYRKAAVQGHPQAEDNYGLALFQNNKREQAVEWLEKSAGRGEPRAQYVLGTMYFNADVVKRDWIRAYALMTRASAAGLPQAVTTLAQMDKYISLTERQRGTELARRYETEAGRPQMPVEVAGGTARKAPAPTVSARVPPTTAAANRVTSGAPATRAAPPPAPAPVAEARVDGGWRVQLGTFRDVGNARNLFASVQAKGAAPGLKSYFERVGALTRLQAGPFATSAAAASACATIKRAGSECVPVRK